MKAISKITVESKTNTGLQILKDRLTQTEKKIIIHMLNNRLNEGKVRNKIFLISGASNNIANVTVGTITKSEILGRNEIIKQNFKIKYS